MQVAGERRPVLGELGRERRQQGIARGAGEVDPARRRAFDRDDVKLAAALGVGAPRRPGGEEVVAQAEAGLEDDEALAPAPASGERIAVEETWRACVKAPARGW